MGCNCGGTKKRAVTKYEVWKDGKKVGESSVRGEAAAIQADAGPGATLKPVTGAGT
jgi:hypothetical protein